MTHFFILYCPYQQISTALCNYSLENIRTLIKKTISMYWKILYINLLFNPFALEKVKQFLYGPGQALRIPGVLGSQISRQLARVNCKVFSLSAGRFCPSGNFPGTHLCQRLSRPQGHSAAGRITSLCFSNKLFKKNAGRSSYCGDWNENDGNDNYNECLLFMSYHKEFYSIAFWWFRLGPKHVGKL